MRKKQLHVAKCIKSVDSRSVNLGLCGRYKRGDFITYYGLPSKNICEACIYGSGEIGDFSEDDRLANYFIKVSVKIVECQ